MTEAGFALAVLEHVNVRVLREVRAGEPCRANPLVLQQPQRPHPAAKFCSARCGILSQGEKKGRYCTRIYHEKKGSVYHVGQPLPGMHDGRVRPRATL